MHEVPPIGPPTVESDVAAKAEPILAPSVLPIDGDTPDRGAVDEDRTAIGAAGDRADEEVDPAPVEEW